MEATRTRTPMQPRPVADLVEFLDLLSGKKRLVPNRTNNNKPQAHTSGKKFKPMTIAEMQTVIGATPKQFRHPTSSTSKPKNWNSSVKVDKSKTLTKDGQLKHSTARKVLNFPPRIRPPPPPANNRTTMAAPVARKSIFPRALANGIGTNRISGVCKVPETPIINKPNSTKLTHHVPRIISIKKINNISFKSDDDSFLQREQEINEFEEKTNAITEEPTLENIAEISPPVSTPFKEYRNVREYFDRSETENSVLWNNNTITVFDKPTEAKEDTKQDSNNIKREESVIVSLCEMLNKATVSNTANSHQELSDLEEHEREMENNIKMFDHAIALINSMKENQLKYLQYIRKFKHEKLQINNVTVVEKENVDPYIQSEEGASTVEKETRPTLKEEIVSPEKSPVTSRPTVINTKSPSYKIPRRSLCLRKKVFHKSLPNVSNVVVTPNRNSDRALSMYMQIKEHMTFLTTPAAKPRSEIPDTPAVTSHNLKKQLDKLYNE